MTNGFAGLAFAVALLAASPAHACWSVDFHTAVFNSEPPSDVAPGMSTFKVEVSNLPQGDPEPVKVKVLESVSVGQDDPLLVDPGKWTDCSVWGEIAGPVYVTGKLTKGGDGKVFLAAVQRRRKQLR